MQFLVRKTHHTTGEVFFDVTRAKENEEFVVVDAENKEEAKEKVQQKLHLDGLHPFGLIVITIVCVSNLAMYLIKHIL
ncbi:DUF1381 domain-containing protein [Staphylococcus cohnii]|uniref:DUF1381 domain-containing protein n=1 Tax=Staphylococcus cohnii TaxID=29382 RepID=UPI003CF59A68